VLLLSRFKFNLASLLVFWGLFVGSGIVVLEIHATLPGDAGTPFPRWPEGSPIPRVGSRPTLLIFLHPCCPCSRASVAELAHIMSRAAGRVSVHAVLLQPTHPSEHWRGSAIEQDLVELRDVLIWQDRGCSEARRFGVATSGHVLLYDAQGRLTFSGGITSARGHEGDNYGRDTVLMQIMGENGNRVGSPVFGCPLATPQSPVIDERPR
jgi:hypothetical protein